MSYPEKQIQTQYDYQTDDAKTVMVEKLLTQNQFTDPAAMNAIVAHGGMDPATERTTYYPSPDFIQDRIERLHSNNRLKEMATPWAIRPFSLHQEHIAEEMFGEALMLESLQGFATRAVTGPAIRSAETKAEGVLGQQSQNKGWRGKLHL